MQSIFKASTWNVKTDLNRNEIVRTFNFFCDFLIKQLFLFSCAFVLVLVAEVFGSTTLFNPESSNTTNEDVLSREKRFLVFAPNGGIIQFISGYLGPIDIPLWQNINCLRNYRFQYELPQRWFTKFSHFPGLTRSEGRSLDGSPDESLKPDSSRKIAYEVVETSLDR